MMGLFLFGYLFALAATMIFLAGASILNERWDCESERAFRLLTLISDRELSDAA